MTPGSVDAGRALGDGLVWGFAHRFRAGLLCLLTLSVACGDETAPTTPTDAEACATAGVGCPCGPGAACGTSERGEALVCLDGSCALPDCTLGERGCSCLGGSTCAGADDRCVDGFCQPVDCTEGTLDCPCAAGTCGADLYCDRSRAGGLCIDGAGQTGGACLDNGLCYGANRCERSIQTCLSCAPGSQGCTPDGERCNDGLILAARRCLSPSQLPPDAPLCYTRCREDRTEEGVHHECIDGLLEGCFDGRSCEDGSCVAPGESPPSCSGDAECPGFQRCLMGRCYADCKRDEECGDGMTCHGRACRVACLRKASGGDDCPRGSYCDSTNGRTGACLPLAATTSPETKPTASTRGGFGLSAERLSLDARRPEVRFTIQSDSPTEESFQVVKLEHRAYGQRGELLEERRLDAGDAPLGFVELAGGEVTAEGLQLSAPARCGEDCPAVAVRLASGSAPASGWTRWEGTLEVRHADFGTQRVALQRTLTPEGRWQGTMHYFGSFPEKGLEEWRADRTATGGLDNAMLLKWSAFRDGKLDGGFAHLATILEATRTESWRNPATVEACRQAHAGACDPVCYLYDNGVGTGDAVWRYTDLCSRSLPTAGSDYPIALELQLQGAAGTQLVGYVDSATTLHYPGDPGVSLALETASCPGGGECVSYLSRFAVDSVLGGRAPVAGTEPCPEGLSAVDTPWLLPGFEAGVARDERGRAVRRECRQGAFPHAAQRALNLNLSGANPSADGRPLRRALRLLDGALIDQRQLLIFFEERFESGLDPDGVSAYGYMLLEHSPAQSASSHGAVPPSAQGPADELDTTPVGPSCDPALIERLYGAGFTLDLVDEETAAQVARDLIAGVAREAGGAGQGTACSGPGQTYPPGDVHYLCDATGQMDGGPEGKQACPVTSHVRYFAFPEGDVDSAMIAALECQLDGSCHEVLEAWLDADYHIDLDPPWLCQDRDAGYCSTDRFDLRSGKDFCRPDRGDPRTLGSLAPLVQQAFRFRTQFASDKNRSLGFAPKICEPGSLHRAYCYDPQAIEAIEARMDCVLSIYRDFAEQPKREIWTAVRAFLSESLASAPADRWGAPLQDGFEGLFADLLIILGDDAHTLALRQRFAGPQVAGAAFRGSLFEHNGLDLSGVAGLEMDGFYRATQYYARATERFFNKLAPVIASALERDDRGPDGEAIVTPALVERTLGSVIGASTKLARVQSEIARRYQLLDRADLALQVIQRSYTRASLESVILSRLMLGIRRRFDTLEAAPVVLAIERAARQYRVALSEMREVHRTIIDGTDAFGLPPGYVPLPTLDEDPRFANAFEFLVYTARQRANTARSYEEAAVQSFESFERSEAQFEQQLVDIGLGHASRLGDICGSFRGDDDGRVYPAVQRFADRSRATAQLGDPCGRVGTGSLHTAALEMLDLVHEQETLEMKTRHVMERIEDAENRAIDLCNVVRARAAFEYQRGSESVTMDDQIRRTRNTVSSIDRAMMASQTFSLDPLAALISLGNVAGAAAAGVLEAQIADMETQLARHDLETAKLSAEFTCEELRTELTYELKERWRELELIELDALRLNLRFALKRSEVARLRLEVDRVLDEWSQQEQLLINSTAAFSDPTQRLYRNATMANAEQTFRRALKHAYRATRALEYFTSQTYPGRDRLYLTRMVSRGQYNLDTYLDQIEDHYDEFRMPQQGDGVPRGGSRSLSVERISLKNDIFRAPLHASGRELDVNERTEAFREWLTSPARVKSNGERSFPFRTVLEELSPKTFNHQIEYLEVQFVGSDLGDEEADIEIWQNGTGVIRNVNGGVDYYQLSPGFVVAHPFFGSARYFEPSVYRRYGLRGRPVVNSSWELVFDQLHNRDNKDVELSSLNDVFIFIYYKSFAGDGSAL